MKLFKYHLKIILANKETLFFFFLFPLILGSLFHFAFQNLMTKSIISNVPVAYFKEGDASFVKLIKNIKVNDKKLLKPKEVKTEEEGLKLLSNGKVKGVYNLENSKVTLTVNNSGTSESVLKAILDQYNLNKTVILNIMKKRGEVDPEIIKTLFKKDDNIKRIYEKEGNPSNIMFYTIFGMISLLGSILGLESIAALKADTSNAGKRFTISPKSRFLTLIIFISGDLLFLLTSHNLSYLMFKYLYNVELNFSYLLFLLIVTLGSLVGIMCGILVGTVLRGESSKKYGILSGATMFLAFCSGMMSPSIKRIIDTKFALFNKINPLNSITNALYSLYYYGGKVHFKESIISLLLVLIVLFITSLIILRKRTYESL